MIGTTIAGKYKVKSLLGSGGMGQVYLCQRLDIGDEVAIKVLTDQINEKELLDEARATVRGNHPNICKVFDYFEENSQGFLVMEKLEGLDLQTLIETKNYNSERFSFRLMFSVIRETALALQHAHNYVLHRDIKPANIFLTSMGEIKVLDFGIAQMISHQIKEEIHPCTEAYSAPDLWVDGKYDPSNYDASHDIYSLGLIFYEMFHLKAGYEKNTDAKKICLSDEFNEAPEGFEELFQKWISHKKSERFQNSQELISAIDELYPSDFNIKSEVQHEVGKSKEKSLRNKTLKNPSQEIFHQPSTMNKDNKWAAAASISLVIGAILFFEHQMNTGKTSQIHEAKVHQIKQQTIKRSIASPSEEDQFSK